MNLRNRDFLSLKDFKKEELETLLELGLEMKRGLDHKEYLSKKTLGLLFSVPSTRTRISFQARPPTGCSCGIFQQHLFATGK